MVVREAAAELASPCCGTRPSGLATDVPGSFVAWATRDLALAEVAVRSEDVAQKTALHLDRFVGLFVAGNGYDRVSACLRRDA